MARLAGVDLPREKRLEIALTYIYGVGRTRAKQTLEATGISPDLRARDLTDDDILKLREHIDARLRQRRLEGIVLRDVNLLRAVGRSLGGERLHAAADEHGRHVAELCRLREHAQRALLQLDRKSVV